MRKQDREILALIADGDNPLSAVYYVPGREHDTNSEARTRWSFQQWAPARVGFKNWRRVTAPVNRLVEAGYADHPSAERRCRVVITDAGRAALAAE